MQVMANTEQVIVNKNSTDEINENEIRTGNRVAMVIYCFKSKVIRLEK